MKTKNQKQSKLNKALKAVVFLGIVGAVAVFAVNDQNSLANKYNISAGNFEDKAGYEVSYINLTGKRTIEDKKIRLSEGYWTSGRFNF